MMKDLFMKVTVAFISMGMVACFIIFSILIGTEISSNLFNDSEAVEVASNPESENYTTGTIESVDVPVVRQQDLSGITENEDNKAQDYGAVQINKYFYNQLEEQEKYIYNAFEKNKEEMKTGTKTINLGNYFSSLLESQNGDTQQLTKSYQSAVEAYFYDNPDTFYLDPNKMYLTVATKTTGSQKEYEVYINNGEEPSYLIDEFSSAEQVNSAIAEVEQVRNSLLSKKTGNTYDESLSAPNIYNIYGALINHYCVCEGYARSMKYVLDAMGIPCVMVVGTGTNPSGNSEKHAWNYVENDDKWYALDATWDDPVAKGGAKVTQADKTRYFMKGASEFNQAHSPSGQFTPGGKMFQYPEIVN